MSIEKHPTKDGWYYVKSYPGGRNAPPLRELFDSYAKAHAHNEAIKNSKFQTKVNIVLHPKFNDIYEEYLAWVKINLAEATHKTRERRLTKYIMPALGNLRAKELQQTDLDRYQTTVGKWTYDTDIRILQAMISWMIERKYAAPLDWKFKHVKGSHNVKPVPHPADLLTAIEKLKHERHRILLKLSLFAGLRWNEVSLLRWENVDLAAMTIGIYETEGEYDFLSIPQPLLEWFKANYKPSGYVFPGRGIDKPYSKLWKPYKEIAEILGRRFSSHTLRHCSGTYLYESTHDLYQVQAHLRHRKISTSQIYARMSVSRRKSAITSIIDYAVNNKDSDKE